MLVSTRLKAPTLGAMVGQFSLKLRPVLLNNLVK